MIKKLKLILFIIFYLYQTSAFSKAVEEKDFNPKYLSNYLSAIISQSNQDNQESVKFFNSSKILINEHENYLKEYVLALVVNKEVKKSINVIRENIGKNNSNFFEAKLLLLIDNIKKKNFLQNVEILNELKQSSDNSNYHYIIYEVLKSYNNLFLNKEVNLNDSSKLGTLSVINEAFQYCYLNKKETDTKFKNLIDKQESDYSRFLFFRINYLINNNDFQSVKKISKTINILNSNLLIQQSKQWIDNSDLTKFNEIFSCQNESDIIAEFFFLISNFLSVDEDFQKSNFYSNLSIYLNPKFYFNLTHLLENYFDNNKFSRAKEILKSFNNEDKIYYWYKSKKIAQIIYNEDDAKKSLEYIEEKFQEYQNPTAKIIYDMANIYKRNKEFQKSIHYYSLVLDKLNISSEEYATVLYNRGSSYERLGEDEKSDKDLIESLKVKQNDPYVLNYLGYSWLEREYNIEEAINMLDKAYKLKKNDPFIIDSVGWGYYLTGDFINAEKFLRKAIQLMPRDPIVNDHYGDVLWKLNRKIQAKYYWQSVLNSKDSDKELKIKISKKLLEGLDES